MQRCLAGLCFLLALFGAILLSQNTAIVSGVVTDATGAVIPNVSIEVKTLATGTVQKVTTDREGKYSLSLPPGIYEVRVQANGFKSYLRTIQLASTAVHLDVKMEIGSSGDVVTVGSASTLLQQDSGQLTKTINPDQISNLPVLSVAAPGLDFVRDPFAIAMTQPGTAAQGKGGGVRGGGGRGYLPRVNGLPSGIPNSGYNTAQYESPAENEFLATTSNPLSTFSADVDTASYSNVRRFLNEGHLPPPAAVRIEELVNYFKYDYPLPKKGDPVAVTTHLMRSPWNSEHQLLHIALRTQPIASEELPPCNLTFLIDVSGSMAPPERLPLIREGLKMLVQQLRAQDRVAIVVYAGEAGVVLPPTPGDHHGVIMSAIDRLQAGGSTNGAAGIKLAYNVARESFMPHGNNRVILGTDGDFNVGVSSDDELIRLIQRERDSGVFLSLLGVGTDNYKDAKMEKLADHGNGNYSYIDSLNETRKVLVSQMGATLMTVAKDVKLQIEFNPAHVKAWRLVGYEDRVLRAEDFNNDRKDAGDLGAGHQVTVMYEIIPAGSNEDVDDVDSLRYQQNPPKPTRPRSAELAWVKLRHKKPQSDTSELMQWPVSDSEIAFRSAPSDVRFGVAVAEYGLLLKQSRFAGNSNFDHVLRTALESLGADLDGYRSEFLELVRKADSLSAREARLR